MRCAVWLMLMLFFGAENLVVVDGVTTKMFCASPSAASHQESGYVCQCKITVASSRNVMKASRCDADGVMLACLPACLPACVCTYLLRPSLFWFLHLSVFLSRHVGTESGGTPPNEPIGTNVRLGLGWLHYTVLYCLEGFRLGCYLWLLSSSSSSSSS